MNEMNRYYAGSTVILQKQARRHAALIAFVSMAAASPVAAQQRIEIRRAADPELSVRLNGSFSMLRIVGWSKDSLVVVGTVPTGARFDGGVSGSPTQPARAAKFFLEQPGLNDQATGTLEVYVPQRARFWSKAGTARIEASGVTGGLDLNIVGGSVTVSGNPRELNVESMDGSVQVTGTPSWMRIKTATGDITITGSSEDAGITTISGNTRVAGGPFERARIESVTGATSFSADVARSATLTIDSHSGLIEYFPGPKTGLEIEANTVAGKIENGLSKQRPIAGREGRGEELALRLGDADARVILRSFKGNIRLGTAR